MPNIKLQAFVPGHPDWVFQYVTAFSPAGQPDIASLQSRYGQLLSQDGNTYSFQETTGGITISGRADAQNVSIAGATSYRAGRLRSRDVRISILGSGHAVVRVSDLLDVNVSGAGAVDYYGSPVVHVTGNGAVRRLG